MTPERCPGCGAKLSPEMLACPNCPMSFPEDDGPADSVNPFKHSKYYGFLLPALFLAAFGVGVWMIGAGLFRMGDDNAKLEKSGLFSNILKENPVRGSARSPGGVSGSHAQTSDAGSVAPARPSGEDLASPTADKADEQEAPGAVSISAPDVAPAALPAPVPPRRAAPKPAVKEWKLRGTVYDLTTLKPLAGCALTFRDETTGKNVETRTDSAGRYRALVPPLSDRGYLASVAKDGYAANYLDPATEGVGGMDAGRRGGLAKGLAATLTPTPASVQAPNAEPLVTDFYLAPRP